MKIKEQKGITMVALVITIIVIAIIASISINEGSKIIKKSKIQTLETNMLAIEAKAKAYAEEIESKVWVLEEGDGENQKNGKRQTEFEAKGMNSVSVGSEALEQVNQSINSSYNAYQLSETCLNNMGLGEIKEEGYIVIFSQSDYKLMDVIYSEGVEYEGTKYYSLSSLKEKLENE